MFNKIKLNPKKQILFVYIVLAVITFVVYWQVNQYDFVHFDDDLYITLNGHIQSGLTMDGLLWAFNTKDADLWHPLIWLSFMFDYQLYGLNAGGYHFTNLILHILSTLLLFWLFHRMTHEIWKSAFVAAFFALHPLHVESVAWVSERKDVLSAFFWMLTLCFYVYYTEKPIIKRYLLVLFSFILALMSKPMVITLPLIMILLDYWPLKKFELRKDKIILWQLKEKLPFFILSLVLVFITFYSPSNNVVYKFLPLVTRLANAPVAFVTYLINTFWPQDMAIFYPFPSHIPTWQVLAATFLIIAFSLSVIFMARRLPHLFVGWFWFVMTIAPVIGIRQIGEFSMADRYHYLPSIGIALMLAWGMPLLFTLKALHKKILFPAAITLLIMMSVITWKQCGYWKNNFSLFNHAIQVTRNNFLAHTSLGLDFFEKGYIGEAIEHYNKAILMKSGYDKAHNNRGIAYVALRQYQLAIGDFNNAIRMHPAFAQYHFNRAYTYDLLGQYPLAIEDYNTAIRLRPAFAEFYYYRGCAYGKINQYHLAYEDCNEAIRLRPNFAGAYMCRGSAYLKQGNKTLGCRDAQTACEMGACGLFEVARSKEICR